MTNEKYNGWTNYETWNFNLWFDDCFTEQAQEFLDDCEGGKDEATRKLASYIEDYADEVLEIPKTGFLADMASAALREVNFEEIAEHYIDDCEYTKEEGVA
ncbi:MAG: hypothetical protein EBZ49_03705 [Proteobacteria bacterium]|nr:hypothetical protein [Pseudomonadota bacterium]